MSNKKSTECREQKLARELHSLSVDDSFRLKIAFERKAPTAQVQATQNCNG